MNVPTFAFEYVRRCGAISLIGLFMLAQAALAAQSPTATLNADFEAFAAYKFGASREPLQRIGEAVRTAAAQHPDAPHTVQELERRLVVVLDGDSTLDAKRFACRLLGEIGGDGSAPTLARMLLDEDTFSIALTALENNVGDAATAYLATALQNAEGTRAKAIIDALGRRGDDAAMAPLMQWLDGPDTDIVVAAAQALAALEDPAACRVAVAAMGSAASEARLALADVCLQCARIFEEADAKNEAALLLTELRAPSWPVHIRIAALARSMALTPATAQEMLLEALDDPEPRMADEALMLARTLPDAEVTQTLIGMLQHATPERKAILLTVLAERGDAKALPKALALADHESSAVRLAALHAVGILGDAELTSFLLKRCSEGPIDEQRTTRAILARVTDPATDDRLIEIAASDAEESLRARAITVLTERGAENAVPALLRIAADDAPAVRAEAVRALRTLAGAEMLPALIDLVHAPQLEDISDVLPQTVAQIAAQIDGANRSVAVVSAFDSAATPETRMLFIDALGLIGGDMAFSAVCAALDMPDVDTRRAAVAALARFQRPEALEVLQHIIVHEDDDAMRGRAYSAYVALMRTTTALSLKALTPHLQTAFDQAQSAAQKRDFLATATRIPSLVTLRLIEALEQDEEVAAEAFRAATQVSVALIGAWPETARKRLEASVSQDHTPALAEQAGQALALMEQFEQHIMAWEMAGPYFEEGVFAEALFDYTFPPETDAGNINWRILPILVDATPPYALELDRVVGGDERVLFLRTRIEAAEAADALLELGTNDGCRVWWNGELVHAINVGRALTPAEDILPVTINAGTNDLMLAVFQHGAAWRATARLVTEAGMPVSGLTFYPGYSE